MASETSPGFATPSRIAVADGTDNGGVVRNPLTHAQRMHAAGAQVERLTNDVDALRAAMRAILNMEGADGMTDARFARPSAGDRPPRPGGHRWPIARVM